jgi:hypothetical protein
LTATEKLKVKKKTFVGAGQMNDWTKDKNFGEKTTLQ